MYISLTSTPNRSCELSTIELCARDVSRWFNENALLLNPTQTEAVFFGTRQRLSQLNTSQGIDVAGTHIQFTDAVKLLGVTLDSTLSFDKHVADVARQCHYHIRALKHIRPLLTLEAAKTFALSIFVGSKLDYCNGVLYGTYQRNMDKLQRVARVTAQGRVMKPQKPIMKAQNKMQ